jgi:hypothetical protein
MLNFNRYKDCGDGVFEYTTLRHNNVGNQDTLSYLNVPWGGVRKSTLSDLVVPFTKAKGGTREGETQYDSLPGWGDDPPDNPTIFDLSDTKGYVMFPEDLPDLGIQDGDPYALPVDMKLTIGGRNCAESKGHTTKWGLLTVKCQITENTVADGAGARGVGVRLTTAHGSVTAKAGVLHWAWNTNNMFFWPDVSVSAVQDVLKPGSVISVSYYLLPTKPVEDNLAIGHVFGTKDSIAGSASLRPTRVRWGGTGTARDFQVYTINSFPRPGITGGVTYYYRQYFMVDRFEDMRATGSNWAPEAHQALYEVDATTSPTGRSVELFASTSSTTESPGVFGAVIGMAATEGCLATGAMSVCVGSTTPKPAFQALYQVKCGSTYAVTNNPYHFAPKTLPNRPYICEGQPTERPEYKLLGFFAATSCAPVAASFHFEETFC